MNLIIELESPIRGTYYEKWRMLNSGGGQKLLEKKVSIWPSKHVNEDRYVYMFLYDSHMRVIPEVFKYLNLKTDFDQEKSKALAPDNTRDKVLRALKFLFSFVELFNVDYTQMTSNQADLLIEFLQGISREGHTTLEFKTRRQNDSVNEYLCEYRSFYKYLGITRHSLSGKHAVYVEKGTAGMMAHAGKHHVEVYDKNLTSSKAKNRVPKYIKEEQFIRMLTIIRTSPKYGLREEVIIRLMYENGMRLGEVLGLTIEDLPGPSELTGSTGELILRNRVSDNKHYQSAKGLHHPKTKVDYNTSQYKTRGVGWQKIDTTKPLLSKIYEYIEEAHGEMSEVNRRNYVSSKADRVTDTELITESEDNYYIFLGKNGTPISSSGWNDVLRRLFEEVGLGLDKEKREYNLSHRFRHGFAMYFIHQLTNEEKKEKIGIERLQQLMRHKSITSTLVYYNPDDEEVVRMNTEHKLHLIEKHPDLLG